MGWAGWAGTGDAPTCGDGSAPVCKTEHACGAASTFEYQDAGAVGGSGSSDVVASFTSSDDVLQATLDLYFDARTVDLNLDGHVDLILSCVNEPCGDAARPSRCGGNC